MNSLTIIQEAIKDKITKIIEHMELEWEVETVYLLVFVVSLLFGRIGVLLVIIGIVFYDKHIDNVNKDKDHE